MIKRYETVHKMTALFKTKVNLQKNGENLDAKFFSMSKSPLEDPENPGSFFLEDGVKIGHTGKFEWMEAVDLPRDSIYIRRDDSYGTISGSELCIKWNQDQIASIEAETINKDCRLSLQVELPENTPKNELSDDSSDELQENTQKNVRVIGRIILDKDLELSNEKVTIPSENHCKNNDETWDKPVPICIDDIKGGTSFYATNYLIGKTNPTCQTRTITYDKNTLNIFDEIDICGDIIGYTGSGELTGPNGDALFQQPDVRNTLDIIEEALELAIPGSIDFIKELVPNYGLLTRRTFGTPQNYKASLEGLAIFRLPSRAKLKELIWTPKCMRKQD